MKQYHAVNIIKFYKDSLRLFIIYFYEYVDWYILPVLKIASQEKRKVKHVWVQWSLP